MFLDKIKIFIKDYGLYLVPLLASFFYFWKVSEISFWFDELVPGSVDKPRQLLRFLGSTKNLNKFLSHGF